MKSVEIVFNDDSYWWNKSLRMNLLTVFCIEDDLRNQLKRSSWICLNDLYDCLKIPRTHEGLKYGWKNDGETDIHFNVKPIDDGPDVKITIDNLVNLLI